MHWLMLQATCSQDADEFLCKELMHNFIWVKKQNKPPKSKQTYRECYYRCLIKSSGCLPQRMLLSSGGKKTQQPKHSQSSCAIRSLIHEACFTRRCVVNLMHIFFSPSYLRAPLPLSQVAPLTPPVCMAERDQAPLLTPSGSSGWLRPRREIHSTKLLISTSLGDPVCITSLPLSDLTEVR